MQKGFISVQTENIFPIIKKFLYSDHEIFLRELISNAVDATSKLKTLARRGETGSDLNDTHIDIIIDEVAGTLTIRDRGIGMSEEEVQKYLNQVAFSSAKDFLEKYQNDTTIIGHFGLGFYSAFMVSSRVEVFTKSYKTGEKAVKWACNGDTEYSIEDIEKAERGTDIVLYINEEDAEFLEKGRIEGLLNKYCKFLPVEIHFGTRKESIEIPAAEENAEPTIETVEIPNIINNPNPAWKKQPAELSDEDYLNFYQELHPHSTPPLFWVHLNIDYPFNLTGILYFPRVGGNQMELQRNKISLYSNQVYVTDEVKEIVPEFLTLLHGVIDSPDIPLNVSRSYLQSDRNVKKITDYITKKVADKLQELFRKDRKVFEDKWESMNVFIKYGFITDDKFAEKAPSFTLLENTGGEYFSLDEYKEKVTANQTDKDDMLIYLYTNNAIEHDSYVQAAKSFGYDVLSLETMIDTHFVQHLERKLEKTRFIRVDSDTIENLIKKTEDPESVLNEEEQKQLESLFNTAISDESATVKLEALSPTTFPLQITRPEFMRRMREMSMMQGLDSNFPEYYNVVVNSNHPLMSEILKNNDGEKATQLFDLARLQQGMLKGAELTSFVNKALGWMK
jgi:molecular chaperone HtpG